MRKLNRIEIERLAKKVYFYKPLDKGSLISKNKKGAKA